MPTQLLSVASGAANSADFTVPAGGTLSVALKDAAGVDTPKGALIFIDMKDDAGQYFQVGRLNYGQKAVQIGPGTFRLRRPANGVTVGAFSG